MALAPGTRLGPYEIDGALGAGGMGEVYRARDTRLNRSVAIKVLLPTLAADAEFRQRFGREARALSGVDHPHICSLYDVGEHAGTPFLVMPLLEGETLAARLDRGPLTPADALTIGSQIADALDRAHHVGLVHRDLKPGNVMLTKAGAKLLDFGLAKRSTGVITQGDSDATMAGTLTERGSLLGTLQYMAPEQLQGRDTDGRTDIFAFGAVLYETLTGHKAFEADSQASIIGAILEREPAPLATLQPLAPPALSRLVRKCLAKDPDDRWQTARDLRDELRWIAGGDASPAAPLRRPRAWPLLVAAVACAIAIVAVGFAVWQRRPADRPAGAAAFYAGYDLPQGLFFGVGSTTRFALSPDGLRIAFAAQDSRVGQRQLWVRQLDSPTAQPLSGTDGASSFFWSPDSRALAFESQGKLKRIDLNGGLATTLISIGGRARGTWGAGGVILYSGPGAGLLRIPATGGTPVQVTTLDVAQGETAHYMPSFLPDGRRFLFAASIAMNQPRGLFLGSLDDRSTKLLLAGVGTAFYANGYLLYVRGTTLVAQPFDVDRAALFGEPRTIADNIELGAGRVPVVSASQTGVIAFMRSDPRALRSQLEIVDRSGKVTSQIGEAADQLAPSVSPDGNRVVVSVLDPVVGTRDLWIHDLRRGTRIRYTSDPGEEMYAVWSADGSELLYSAARVGSLDIFRRQSSGVGQPTLVIEGGGFNKYISDWSHDGRTALYFSGLGGGALTQQDIWYADLTGTPVGKPLVQTNYPEQHARFAPNDNRWVAFQSSASGRQEIYLTTSKPGGLIEPVSNEGGTNPKWRADGKELFYVARDRLMAVSVDWTGATPNVGQPKPLFDLRVRAGDYIGFFAGTGYDVMPDGNHFLLNTLPPGDGPRPIDIVANWPSLLNK